MLPTDLPPKLATRISVDEAGHWMWIGAITSSGYGQTSCFYVGTEIANRKGTLKAHRVVWQFLVGEIPEGLELDHLCRVRACVNPAHLEPVTHLVNCRRGTSAEVMREKYAAPRDCPQGHPLEGDNLYIHITQKGYPNRQCRACGRAKTKAYEQRQRARISA